MTYFVIGVAVLVAVPGGWWVLRSRNMHLWIGSYLGQVPRRFWRRRPAHTKVYFCFCDHYEPYWNKVDRETAHRRVQRWLDAYPRVAEEHRDSAGRAPRHSFFYPEEEYDEKILDGLGRMCREGFGEVEVHLHHDNDTAENLRSTLARYTQMLHDRHGLLRRDPETGQLLYCFIHGNWALDNSRPDGRWCGVDNELSVLVETGCRCDLTMPSAPSDTQTKMVNSIYFAHGCPGKRKSHNRGRDCAVGEWAEPGELLLIQGPLTLNWRDRKAGILPRIESGEISADAPPTPERVKRWERCGITVRGAEDHLFIKVHTHGAEERTADMLLDGGFDRLWTALEQRFRDRPGFSLHYVSAWEMYETVRRLCLGGAAE
jgi:hypothetical protein